MFPWSKSSGFSQFHNRMLPPPCKVLTYKKKITLACVIQPGNYTWLKDKRLFKIVFEHEKLTIYKLLYYLKSEMNKSLA